MSSKTKGIEFEPVWNAYEEMKCPHCGQFDDWTDEKFNKCECGSRVRLPQKKGHRFLYYSPN